MLTRGKVTKSAEEFVNTKLLRVVADAIEKLPEAYDQYSFGPIAKARSVDGAMHHAATPSCHTPCCVAAHIAYECNYDPLGDEDMASFAIRQLVKDVLDYRTVACRILNTYWPFDWFDLAGVIPRTETTSPSAEHAVRILRYLANNPEHLIKKD